MTANRGPGVAVVGGVGTTTLEHRLQLAGQYAENAPGVPRSGVLGQGTALLVTGKATMAYDIGPCALVISRTAGEGVYTPTLTGTTTVNTTAAPASNSRWDLIYVKQNDTAKGDVDNQVIVGVTQGTSGATPTKPYGTVPTGAIVLAEAQVFATTTGTSGGSNTITQVWRHTVARGAPVPVRNTTERAELTAYLGAQAQRLDKNGLIDTGNGTGWFGRDAGDIAMGAFYEWYGQPSSAYSKPGWETTPDGWARLLGGVGTNQATINLAGGTFYTLGTVPSGAGGVAPPTTKAFRVATATATAPNGADIYVNNAGAIQLLLPATINVAKGNFFISLEGIQWKL